MIKTFQVIDTAPAQPGEINYEFNRAHHLRFPFTVVDEVGRKYGYGFSTRKAAEDKVAQLEWEYSLPVGIRTNCLLVDVRAVRSKAQTTIDYSRHEPQDEEDQAILADLAAVVERLDRWARTGKTPKRPKTSS